ALLDPGRIGGLMEHAAELAGRHRLARPLAGKQPAFSHGRCGIVTRSAHLPPFAQQIEHLGRQHDIAVLAALGLLDPNDVLRSVEMPDLHADDLASTEAAAISETEQNAHLEPACDREQAARLVLAHHLWNPLWLTKMVDLGCKVRPPQGDAKQEL